MLTDVAAMTEVESLMQRLAQSPAPDKASEIVGEHLQTGGKRLRARLALAATEALSGARRRAVPWAAACELLHNGTLIHDDLQDGDRVRRGHPTTWVRHGAAHAINAGDLLLILPFVAVAELDAPPAVRAELSRVLATHAAAVIRGQIAEHEMTSHGRAEWPVYRAAIAGKTSALFELPVEGAALLAGRTPAEAHRLTAPFRALGVLFQMQDDVLDLYGDKGREAPGADLREGKISALVVEHSVRYPRERDAVLAFLKAPREQKSQAQIDAMIARLREGGALAEVCRTLRAEARAAVEAPELAGEAALAAVMRELVALVLAPIAHVMADGVAQPS